MKAQRGAAAGPEVPGGWMGSAAAAKYAGINQKVLERLAKKGKVRSGKLGRIYRFKAEHIDALLEKGGFDGTIKTGRSS